MHCNNAPENISSDSHHPPLYIISKKLGSRYAIKAEVLVIISIKKKVLLHYSFSTTDSTFLDESDDDKSLFRGILF